MIEATSNNRSEELRQVKTCIELAMRCVDSERDNRPSVADILDTLNKTETHIPKRQVLSAYLMQTKRKLEHLFTIGIRQLFLHMG